ncbi:MAG: hypothetical protein OXU67_02400 [Chloroflexota bacterium]|nr:hypothetical protein [Chloroflexota bacterium]
MSSIAPILATGNSRSVTPIDFVRVLVNAGGIAELQRSADVLPEMRPSAVLNWVDHYAEGVLASLQGFLLEFLDRPGGEWRIVPQPKRRRSRS